MEKIFGVGVDQVEIDRVKRACEKGTFLKKFYSDREQLLVNERRGRAATNFAGKEAVVKALRTGFGKVLPSEVEILREESGAPYVELTGHALERMKECGISKIHISLSDSTEYAIAYAVAVMNE